MLKQNKLAIFTRAFNRTRTLKTFLEAMGEAHRYCPRADLWLLFDGAQNPVSQECYAENPEELITTRELVAKSPLLDITDLRVLYSKNNLGCATHKYIQLTTLFDQQGYDYAILIDNDYEVCPSYIERALHLFEQFDDEPSGGMLQMSPRLHGNYTASFAEANADRVTHGFGPRGEIGIWSWMWNKIRNDYIEYYNDIKSLDFRQVITERGPEFKRLVNVYGSAHADQMLEILVKKHGGQGILTKARHYRIMQQHGWYSGKNGKYYRPEYTDLKLHNLPNVEEYILE